MSAALVTTLLFLLACAWLVVRHMRRSATAPVETCPRCHAALVPGAVRCRGCGAPVGAFEVVRAAEAVPEAAGAAPADAGRLHAIVRADVCVGCGSCVGACPVPGAIAMRGKLAVVDLALCEGHGRCAEACPTSAIVVTTGAAVQRVVVPALDAHFQSNVPGLYIAGELGGRGLIKNAINEARIAVEHVAAAPRSDAPDVCDVIIAGAGPAGLSAALEAQRLGLRYVAIEQGTLAETIAKYPRHKLLLAEPVNIPLYGALWVADTSKETLLGVWETIVRRHALDVRTRHRVTDVRRGDDGFVVETTGGTFRGRAVVLAFGRRGTPRRLGVPGEELPKVVYEVAEMEDFAGRRVLVVGGGDSAVESALGLANQPGTTVHLSYRKTAFDRVKERNRALLEKALAARRVHPLLGTVVRQIGPDEVLLDGPDGVERLPNDDVIVRIGGDPPYPFLERIGVRMITKDLPIAGGA